MKSSQKIYFDILFHFEFTPKFYHLFLSGNFNFQLVPLICNLISTKRNEYHSLVEYPGLYIYPNSRKNTAYNRICSENIDKTIQKCIKKLVFVLSSGFASVFSAEYATFFLNNKTTTTELKFPFIDDENMEFYLNSIIQLISVCNGFLLYTGVEVAMTIFENFATLLPKLLYNEFAQKVDMYEQKQLTKPQLRILFKNALVLPMEHNRYVFNLFDIPFSFDC